MPALPAGAGPRAGVLGVDRGPGLGSTRPTASEPECETCEIKLDVLRRGLFWYACRLVAEAVGDQGGFVTGMSEVFVLPTGTDWDCVDADVDVPALEHLRATIEEQGWRQVGRGACWYSYRFGRASGRESC